MPTFKFFWDYRMNSKVIYLAVILMFTATTPAICATKSQIKSPPIEAYIISPKDGDVVKNPFTVRFGLKGMGIAPAGTEIENTGHHHLIIDTKLPSVDAPIPSDANHIHYGLGQTETELTLPPGKHTLQLLLGNWTHIPHAKPVFSKQISITVKPQ
jgi:hypothetical protein